MNDLISIILPVYNREEYLPDCMASIFNQSHKNLQIILIDDGSTDSTPVLCKEYAAKDSRVVLLRGEHAGVSAARNLGLDAATGQYIFFLDSDDAIHPELLETLAKAMTESGAPMSGTRVINIPEYQWNMVPSLIQRSPVPGKTKVYSPDETIYNVYHGQSPFGVIGGVMMRRDWIGQTRFRTDIFIGEDYYFIYENLIKGASSIFLQQKWYYCRLHGTNSSRNYGYDGFWTRFYRRKLVWESEEALGRPENAKKEKHSAFMAYLTCVQINQMPKEDRKKMCAVMKTHRKEILPALNFPRKVRFYLTVYLPLTHRIYCRIARLFKKK